MLGFLKNLFRDSAPAPAATIAPVPAAPPPPRPIAPPVAAPPPPPVAAPPVAKPPPPPPPISTTAKTGGVRLPLQKVLAGLSPELQSRACRSDLGSATVFIPLDKILPQLASGAVKISFGELRHAAPESFSRDADRDRIQVFLPLAEILAQLNPALLARRQSQKQVEIPAEIGGAFDLRGEQLSFASTPVKSQSAANPPPAPEPPASRPAQREANGTSVPAALYSAPPAPAPPPIPFPASGSGTRATLPLPTPTAESPLNRSLASPSRNGGGLIPPKAFVPTAPALPSTAANRISPPAPTPTNGVHKPAIAKPSPQPIFPKGAALVMPLQVLSEAWPPAIRKLIADQNLTYAQVSLPLEFLDQGLKQGRIAVAWKALRAWFEPAHALPSSPQDSIVVELPLKIIVPQFLARQRSASAPRERVAVDKNIPDLFFGFPQPEPPSPAATPLPEARATSLPFVSQDTNYFSKEEASEPAASAAPGEGNPRSPGTKFVTKYAAPNEIVARAAALEGVAGALIALPDGLMVASQLPPDLNSDTLAAFLPQIFNRVNQCTKELRMGELNNLNFTVGKTPWKIFRVNAIFFAAFGRPGQSMPSAQLATLAGELDHKPK